MRPKKAKSNKIKKVVVYTNLQNGVIELKLQNPILVANKKDEKLSI